MVRKSIIGDVFTKNTLKLKDVKELKLEKNDSTGKDNPHQDLTNDFEKMLMTMSEIKVQNDCPFSNSFENIRKEAELTIGYLKDLNHKLSRLEFEGTEKDKTIKIQRDELKQKKDDQRKTTNFKEEVNYNQANNKAASKGSSDNSEVILFLKQLQEQITELNNITKENARLDNNSEIVNINKEILQYIMEIKKKSVDGLKALEVKANKELSNNEPKTLKEDNSQLRKLNEQIESLNDSKNLMFDMLKSILLNSNNIVKS